MSIDLNFNPQTMKWEKTTTTPAAKAKVGPWYQSGYSPTTGATGNAPEYVPGGGWSDNIQQKQQNWGKVRVPQPERGKGEAPDIPSENLNISRGELAGKLARYADTNSMFGLNYSAADATAVGTQVASYGLQYAGVEAAKAGMLGLGKGLAFGVAPVVSALPTLDKVREAAITNKYKDSMGFKGVPEDVRTQIEDMDLGVTDLLGLDNALNNQGTQFSNNAQMAYTRANTSSPRVQSRASAFANTSYVSDAVNSMEGNYVEVEDVSPPTGVETPFMGPSIPDTSFVQAAEEDLQYSLADEMRADKYTMMDKVVSDPVGFTMNMLDTPIGPETNISAFPDEVPLTNTPTVNPFGAPVNLRGVLSPKAFAAYHRLSPHIKAMEQAQAVYNTDIEDAEAQMEAAYSATADNYHSFTNAEAYTKARTIAGMGSDGPSGFDRVTGVGYGAYKGKTRAWDGTMTEPDSFVGGVGEQGVAGSHGEGATTDNTHSDKAGEGSFGGLSERGFAGDEGADEKGID